MTEKQVTILQMNDLHGYLSPHMEYFWKGSSQTFKKVGGFAKIAGYFEKLREEKKGVLIGDNGDTIHGTYPVVKSKGEQMIPLLNDLVFDGMTAHWDFAYGPKHLEKLDKKLNYPILAVNCYEEKTDKLVFNPYRIVEKNDLQIAILGVAATIVDKTMPESFSEGIYLTNGIEELKTHIESLKKEEKVDLVVVLSHMGYPQECQMAKMVDNIDIFLSGHTHNRVYQPTIINDTIIIQSGCHGSFIGQLDVVVENKKVKEYKHQLVPMDENIPTNESMAEKVTKVMEPIEEKLNVELGKTKTALTRDKVMEATMDAFLLESLKKAAGTDIAFSNGWRYGAPIAPGPIKENDLWNIIPVNPPISVCEITGKELYEMMEENLERTFSRNPLEQMGGYVKRCAGINVYFKIESPKNNRIQEFYVNGKRLDWGKKYKVCYVTSQGVPKHFGMKKENLEISAIEAMRSYLEKNETIEVKLQNTIVPI
jgi:2',3'-cyclic-nucleotide 2'-phosphodiesterase (5'-nucleotidase family)